MKSSLYSASVFFLICIGLGLNACKRELSKKELAQYINDPENGLFLEKTVRNYSISANYYPTDFVVQRELNSKRNKQDIESLTTSLKNTLYFNIAISDEGREVFNRFIHQKEKLEQLSDRLTYKMEQFAYARTSLSDSIPLEAFVTPLTYGMSNHTKIRFSFHANLENTEWVELVISEFGLGIGAQKFRFDTKHINQTPSLNFKTLDHERT